MTEIRIGFLNKFIGDGGFNATVGVPWELANAPRVEQIAAALHNFERIIDGLRDLEALPADELEWIRAEYGFTDSAFSALS